MTHRIRKAVIPVAGFGTRFLPVSKSVPKEMLPLVNRPIIEYVVREFVEAGIEEIIFISSSNKHALEDYFDYNNELDAALRAAGKEAQLKESRAAAQLARFSYVHQREQLGNGHALMQAQHLIGDEPFAFAYGDDVIEARPSATAQMIETFHDHPGTIVGAIEVPRDVVNRYGIFDPEPIDPNTFRVKRMIEKPSLDEAPSTLMNPGRYLFTPAIFAALDAIEPGKGGELWLADAVAKLGESEPIYGRRITGTYYDCGNVLEYVKAVVHFASEDAAIGQEFSRWLKESHINF